MSISCMTSNGPVQVPTLSGGGKSGTTEKNYGYGKRNKIT